MARTNSDTAYLASSVTKAELALGFLLTAILLIPGTFSGFSTMSNGTMFDIVFGFFLLAGPSLLWTMSAASSIAMLRVGLQAPACFAAIIPLAAFPVICAIMLG